MSASRYKRRYPIRAILCAPKFSRSPNTATFVYLNPYIKDLISRKAMLDRHILLKTVKLPTYEDDVPPPPPPPPPFVMLRRRRSFVLFDNSTK